jgi:hypothetical protein
MAKPLQTYWGAGERLLYFFTSEIFWAQLVDQTITRFRVRGPLHLDDDLGQTGATLTRGYHPQIKSLPARYLIFPEYKRMNLHPIRDPR